MPAAPGVQAPDAPPGAPSPPGFIERARRWLQALATVPCVLRSGLFDRTFYAQRYPDVAVSHLPSLMHYLVHGWREGRSPHPLFDSRWYLENYPDVARQRVEPLSHFLRHGHREGNNPHPLFDTSFYLDHCPDVRAAGMNPLVHFLRHGNQEGRNPHPLFLTTWYLQEYAGDGFTGNALLQYLDSGARQGFDPHPLFDSAWYLKANPDVARAGVNPLEHYLRRGWLEGRDPNPFFNTWLYLQNCPEAREANCPPLVYCVTHQAADGDLAHRMAGAAVMIIDHRFPMPDVDSGSVRMDGIVDAFKHLGYSVTFVSDNETVTHAYRKRLADKGVYPLVGIDSAFGHLERQGGGYSVVIVSRPGIGTRYLLAVRASAPRALVLYDMVDLHWLRYLRTAEVTGDRAHLLDADNHLRCESYCIRASDLTIAITEDEKRYVESKWPGSRVEVLHNIHRTDPLPVNWERRSGLVFIGGFEHEPNCDAMIWFVQSILPLVTAVKPGITLTILGSKTPEKVRALASESVQVVGYVPRVEPHFERARVFISPLRIGAGMKGKIGQAMSLGLPVVTTPVGAEGMSIVDGRHALIAADAAAFAAKILELYDDFTLWQSLRGNALLLVEERFSPQAAEAAIRRILSDAESRRDEAMRVGA